MFRRTKRTGHASEPLLSVYRDFGVIYKASRDDNFNKPSDDLGLYQLVEPGDLAINKMKAWQGSVAISEIRGIVSPAYFVYKSLHVENNEYLHYLFRSAQYVAGYFSISKGIRINQWDLEPEYHSRLPVLMPPPDEQRVIAAFLDRETARRLISATLPSGKVLDETAVRVLVGEERVQPPVVPTRPWRMSQPPLNPPLNRLS
jgi:type I restriction enzyme, S subunit